MNATRCQCCQCCQCCWCQCCCCCFVILQPINVDIPWRIAAGGQCGVRWTCPAAQANLADCRADLTLAAASNCCVNLIATECFHSQTEFCTPRWLHLLFSVSISVSPHTKVSIIKEGFLLKHTWSFQRWRSRYFRLKRNLLYYAKDAKVSKANVLKKKNKTQNFHSHEFFLSFINIHFTFGPILSRSNPLGRSCVCPSPNWTCCWHNLFINLVAALMIPNCQSNA